MEEKDKFDYEAFEKEAIRSLMQGKPLSGAEGVLTPLIKRIMEASLQGEMDAHLQGEGGKENRRNGYGNKRVKTAQGEVDIRTPRDRAGTFEPLLIEKRQRVLNEELDLKILRLYSSGMSTRDIRENVRDLYGIEVSEATISSVTDQVRSAVRAWQCRPLETMYPIVWMDAIHFKVKEDGRVVTKAVYTLLAQTRDGYKELLGLYVERTEGAKFWMTVLDDLKQRGVQDILIACIDNLKGFVEAIEVVFPQSDIQLCIVHQIRNTLKYVNWRDYKEVVSDMRKIYRAPNEELALAALEVFAEKWRKKYPQAVRSWENNWTRLSSQFRYTEAIRKLIYTTNPIEGFHAQLRKYTKTKRVFDGDWALLKLLYLVQLRIMEKLSQKQRLNWKAIAAELRITFGQRFDPTWTDIDQQVVSLPQTPSLKNQQYQQRPLTQFI